MHNKRLEDNTLLRGSNQASNLTLFSTMLQGTLGVPTMIGAQSRKYQAYCQSTSCQDPEATQ
eukprot:2223932-Amphidinium_carterae.1